LEATVGHDCWTVEEMRTELQRFKSELEAAGLTHSSVNTYVDRSERFVRWLAGEYRPGERPMP
jgi:hypothetical protein